VDLVRASNPKEPLSSFLTMFYYGKGVFPWLVRNDRVLWWSPQPRAVLFCKEIHVSRSLRKTLRQGRYRVTADTAFEQVVLMCRDVERGLDPDKHPSSWINDDFVDVFLNLHKLGHAHSVETWEGDQLVGGLFGVCVGQIFYGCSMFHVRPNASKVALVRLTQVLHEWGFPVIDCQICNPHLKRMGARLVPRKKFHELVEALVRGKRKIGPWTSEFVDLDGRA
jgi:leucyl/phenylalanyl-tRNA--protein transferase